VGRILAIDYGMTRCGIAVTDPLQIIGQPLDTIPKEDLVQFLKKYILEENVETLVLGIPYNMDGTLSEMALAILAFKKTLLKLFPNIPIHEVDERLTSKEAQRIVVQSVKSKKKRRNNKGLIDMVSASLILESFMNQQRKI